MGKLGRSWAGPSDALRLGGKPPACSQQQVSVGGWQLTRSFARDNPGPLAPIQTTASRQSRGCRWGDA